MFYNKTTRGGIFFVKQHQVRNFKNRSTCKRCSADACKRYRHIWMRKRSKRLNPMIIYHNMMMMRILEIDSEDEDGVKEIKYLWQKGIWQKRKESCYQEAQKIRESHAEPKRNEVKAIKYKWCLWQRSRKIQYMLHIKQLLESIVLTWNYWKIYS